MARLPPTALALGLLVGLGCTIDTGDPVPPERGTDPRFTEEPAPIRKDASPGEEGEPDERDTDPTVTIQSTQTVTAWDSIPISGTGPARGTVVVETMAGGTVDEDISAEGTFCVDVPLVADSVNRLRFRGLTADGVYGEWRELEVTQEGEPVAESPEPSQTRFNAARGGSIARSSMSDIEREAALTDGDLATFATLWDDIWPDTDDFIVLELSERSEIELVRVLTTADCPLEDFDVLVSDDNNPTDPVSGNSGWEVVGWSGDEWSFAPRMTRFIGIDFNSGDCRAGWGQGRHRIREIEAWTPPVTERGPPPASAPTCQSGGTR